MKEGGGGGGVGGKGGYGGYGWPIKRTRTGIGSDGRKDKSATGNLPNPVLRLLCFLPFMQSVKQVTDDR